MQHCFKAKWSHCYTAASGTTLFQGQMESLLHCCIWYNIVSRPNGVIVTLLHLVQHCFKAKWSHCYTAASSTTLFQGQMESLLHCCIWYNIVSRPNGVIVTLLHLVQHCFKAKWSHCYTAASGTTLFQGQMESLLHCCIWYNIVSRPNGVIVTLLHLVQHCFKAKWSHCYTAASGTTLFQGQMESLLHCCIWYNIVSRPNGVIVTLLHLVQHCFKAKWSHCYTAASGTTLFQGQMESLLHCCIWYNIVSRPNGVIVTLLHLVQHCFKAKWSHCYTAASSTTLFQGQMESLLHCCI